MSDCSAINMQSALNFGFRLAALPDVSYTVQKVSLPNITLGIAQSPTPFIKIPRPGNLKYGTFSISFKVSEDLSNYLAIFDWMEQIGHPEEFSKPDFMYSDSTVIITNSSRRPSTYLNFKDCFPIELTPLAFDATLSTTQYIDVTATFAFGRMKFSKTDT